MLIFVGLLCIIRTYFSSEIKFSRCQRLFFHRDCCKPVSSLWKKILGSSQQSLHLSFLALFESLWIPWKLFGSLRTKVSSLVYEKGQSVIEISKLKHCWAPLLQWQWDEGNEACVFSALVLLTQLKLRILLTRENQKSSDRVQGSGPTKVSRQIFCLQ